MNSPAVNWRETLTTLRTALLRLHKTLLDAERLRYETAHGPIKSNGEYLQLLIHDPQFTWLQPYTRLVVNCDETLESKDPVTAEQVQSLWTRARGLTVEQATGSAYQDMVAVSVEVKTAHEEVAGLVGRG